MAGFQGNIGAHSAIGYLFSNTMLSVRSGRAEKTEDKGPDLKLQRIVNKFKAGKKLSSGELSYLADRNPSLHQKVVRIMREREMLEAKLNQAGSKEEAAKILAQEMNNIDKLSNNDEFETTARVNQYNDAYTEFVKSDGYEDMSDTDMKAAEEKSARRRERTGQDEEENRKKRKKRKKKAHSQEDVMDRLRYATVGLGMEESFWESGLTADYEPSGSLRESGFAKGYRPCGSTGGSGAAPEPRRRGRSAGPYASEGGAKIDVGV